MFRFSFVSVYVGLFGRFEGRRLFLVGSIVETRKGLEFRCVEFFLGSFFFE